MAKIETIAVKMREGGRSRIINRADFDAALHDTAETPGLTRDAIDKMKRADVVDLLDAHGFDDVVGKKVGELRAILTNIVFVEI